MFASLLVLLMACGTSEPPAPPASPALPTAHNSPATTPAPARPAIQVPDRGVIPPEPTPEEGVVLTKDRCDDIQHGGKTDGCITGTIKCGESLTGHTLGGTKLYDSKWYMHNFCTPDTTNHDGGDERIYTLEMPDGDWHAEVFLDTPCADLDLAAMPWNKDGCPTASDSVSQCEMWPKRRNKRERVELVSQKATTWLIVVEGKDNEEGAFGLSVECRKGLY